jgi:hypothetical protein
MHRERWQKFFTPHRGSKNLRESGEAAKEQLDELMIGETGEAQSRHGGPTFFAQEQDRPRNRLKPGAGIERSAGDAKHAEGVPAGDEYGDEEETRYEGPIGQTPQFGTNRRRDQAVAW